MNEYNPKQRCELRSKYWRKSGSLLSIIESFSIVLGFFPLFCTCITVLAHIGPVDGQVVYYICEQTNNVLFFQGRFTDFENIPDLMYNMTALNSIHERYYTYITPEYVFAALFTFLVFIVMTTNYIRVRYYYLFNSKLYALNTIILNYFLGVSIFFLVTHVCAQASYSWRPDHFPAQKTPVRMLGWLLLLFVYMALLLKEYHKRSTDFVLAAYGPVDETREYIKIAIKRKGKKFEEDFFDGYRHMSIDKKAPNFVDFT